jgi:hypothetical protein
MKKSKLTPAQRRVLQGVAEGRVFRNPLLGGWTHGTKPADIQMVRLLRLGYIFNDYAATITAAGREALDEAK